MLPWLYRGFLNYDTFGSKKKLFCAKFVLEPLYCTMCPKKSSGGPWRIFNFKVRLYMRNGIFLKLHVSEDLLNIEIHAMQGVGAQCTLNTSLNLLWVGWYTLVLLHIISWGEIQKKTKNLFFGLTERK